MESDGVCDMKATQRLLLTFTGFGPGSNALGQGLVKSSFTAPRLPTVSQIAPLGPSTMKASQIRYLAPICDPYLAPICGSYLAPISDPYLTPMCGSYPAPVCGSYLAPICST
eukprot:3744967-Rhodomonas_salina.2